MNRSTKLFLASIAILLGGYLTYSNHKLLTQNGCNSKYELVIKTSSKNKAITATKSVSPNFASQVKKSEYIELNYPQSNPTFEQLSMPNLRHSVNILNVGDTKVRFLFTTDQLSEPTIKSLEDYLRNKNWNVELESK